MKWWSLEIPSCDAVRAIFSLSSLAGSTCLARCPRVARVPEGQRIIAGDFARRGRGTCLAYQGYLSDHVPHRRTPLQPGGLRRGLYNTTRRKLCRPAGDSTKFGSLAKKRVNTY